MPTPRHRQVTIVRSRKQRRHGVTQGEAFETGHEPTPEDISSLTHVATIGVSHRLTENLGEGNFLQVGCSVEWPCAPDEASAKRTHAFAKKLSLEFIDADMQELKKNL